jgi:cytochrome b
MSSGLKKTWDLPTRATHWLLALVIVINLFVLEEGEQIHEWLGYFGVALVFFRIIWGFIGAEASRWRSLPLSFTHLLAHARAEVSLKPIDYPGHNPLGSLTYVLIWTMVVALGISGFMMDLDAFWGEEWLEEIHEVISVILQVLIVVHLTGVFIDSYRHRRKTWANMMNGKKTN